MSAHATEGQRYDRPNDSNISSNDARPVFSGENALEPIAVVGFSLGFPQTATCSDAFWKILVEKRNTVTEFPKSRMNIDAMYHPDSNRRGQVPVRHSHFLQDDIASFDAPFFSTSTTDAASMDPQQRLLLEYTYKALESAGMPIETVSGTKTSVYVGSFSTDWLHLAYKDGEQCGVTTALGVQACFNANRISWFFDFTGNSANIDTACSSSLVCLDMGCQGLRTQEDEMSIVAGSNLILSPDTMHSLTNLNMLSPDGQCYSFDHRANGYSRGEGIGVLILKRVSDALRDHDTIRGIIRSTGCNQDGNTPSITLPNNSSQEKLIRHTYNKAGLSMEPTRFFEAHGTGTPVGDPHECKAIGATFRNTRRARDPLWVGAVKGNIGHLEGASGIAGVIKALLVLEKAIIPPNVNFEKTNPKIDTEFLRIQFPLEPMVWPVKGLRRASVNSFGNAGTNAHVILDDVFHFLELRGLSGCHLTTRDPPNEPKFQPTILQLQFWEQVQPSSDLASRAEKPRLLILSAYDEAGVKRQAMEFASYFSTVVLPRNFQQAYLDNLAFTLSLRRSSLSWKSYAVVKSFNDLRDIGNLISPAKRPIPDPSIAFIFTGQGAQWAGMGRGLMGFPAFLRSLLASEEYLQSLGCVWRLRTELSQEKDSNLNMPELSQPICTAIQIALVDLLYSFGVFPTVVIGHSSGEIAAAYSTGALSAISALGLAYHRGTLAGSLARSQEKRGAMMSVGLSKDDVLPYLDEAGARFDRVGLTVACLNSPRNVTISGDEDQIAALEKMLILEKVYTRRLFVSVAYHSPHMQAIADDYYKRIKIIQRGTMPMKTIAMISSVTGQRILQDDLLSPQYWTENLISPVNFADAVHYLLYRTSQKVRKKLDLSHRDYFHISMLVEVGPHSVLQGPINDILVRSRKTPSISYTALLIRNKDAFHTILNAIGQIKCLGCSVDMELVNSIETKVGGSRMALPDLPEYSFNHSRQHWEESRYSLRYRTHHQGRLDLLGKPVPNWNPMEPTWRNFLRTSEMSWIEDHVINGSIIYPGAGMLAMVIEAANQISHTNPIVVGFELKEVYFPRPIKITQDSAGVETQLSIRTTDESSKPLEMWSEFRLFAYEQNSLHECCRGSVRIRYSTGANEVDDGREDLAELKTFQQIEQSVMNACQNSIDTHTFYGTLNKSGLGLGSAFQRIKCGAFGTNEQAYGIINLFEWPRSEYPQLHVIHPTSLDGIFHLAVAGYSRGGERRIPTMVPTFLRKLYVSRTGLSFPESQEIQEFASMSNEDSLAAEFDGFALSSSKDSIVVHFEGLRLTKIGEVFADQTDESRQPTCGCFFLEYRPDPDLYSSTEVLSYLQRTHDLTKSPFVSYVDMLAHKISNLKVLEINLENEALRAELLWALANYGDNPNGTGYVRYDSFVFTSDSQTALDQARGELQGFPYVAFMLFDVQKDPVEQGFDAQTYDIILTSSSISENEVALRHINKLLKPDGKLVLHRTNPTNVFRKQYSSAESSYGSLFKNGFVAQGSVMSTKRSEEQLQMSFQIHDRILPPSTQQDNHQVFIIVDQDLPLQSGLSRSLADLLRSHGLLHVMIISLDEVSNMDVMKTNLLFITLLEIDGPFLYSISKEHYSILQRLFVSTSNILWVTSSGRSAAPKPEYSLIYGLARALHSEYNDHRLTIVSFQCHNSLSELQMQSLVKVFLRRFIAPNANPDTEYLEIQGMLNIPRVVPALRVSHELYERSRKQRSKINLVKDAPPLKLTMMHPGLLDSFHFTEDRTAYEPLAKDEVEIQTKAIGMNFKDCLAALGQIANGMIGQECAGTVVRAGLEAPFVIGDRVILAADGTFKTVVCAKVHSALKIPDEMPFTTAAAIPAQFGTAWEVIYRLAQLRSGETILIHAAAGGTGQAAVQLAKLIGATVFATVGSKSKKQLLIDEYQIPCDHIFYSRNTKFARGIMRMTGGQGVDVIINCLVGEGLLASWECIAPYGRFVEIGKKDIASNSSLPMFTFRKGASFITFDGAQWYKDRPVEANKDLKALVDLFTRKKLHLPRPLHIYDISDVETVFRLVQDGGVAGKFVLEVTPNSQIPSVLETKPSFQLNSDATYVISGGLGGVGRATARWMVTYGARNLILLSRFGPRTESATECIKDLRAQKVRVETPACDITDYKTTQEVFARLSPIMPPIKGCIQGSVIAKDGLFKDMTYDNWQAAVGCKTHGSWNLHTILPQGMDFFILLASSSGLAGIRGQTNYDAGNTYQDALARYRVACGEKAVALDLGALADDGILAENPDLLNRVLSYGALEPISRRQFHAILDYYCDPLRPRPTSPDQAQIAIGLGLGGDGSSGLESLDYFKQPMLRPLFYEKARQAAAAAAGGGSVARATTSNSTGTAATNYREQFASSASLTAAASVVSRAIIVKLARSLSAIHDDDKAAGGGDGTAGGVDMHRPLQMYGVDSLLAIELRNWIVREFRTEEIAVFETQGAATLETLSRLVVERSRIGHGRWDEEGEGDEANPSYTTTSTYEP